MTSLLEKAMPKECTRNGHKYKEGETFQDGKLRYKCQKYGVYSIEGCITSNGHQLGRDESKLENNVLYQCLTAGNSIFYKETSCGGEGMISCDKVPKPKGYEENLRKIVENGFAQEKEKSHVLQNPKGWRVVEEGSKKLPGHNGTMIFRTLMFDGIQSRVRRDSNDNLDLSKMHLGKGVGRVIGMEEVGNDKPQMPADLFDELTRKNNHHQEASKTHSNAQFPCPCPQHPKSVSGSKVVSTQTVGVHVPTSTMQKGNVVTGTEDLKARTQTQSAGGSFKPGSTSGFKTNLKWNGKTIERGTAGLEIFREGGIDGDGESNIHLSRFRISESMGDIVADALEQLTAEQIEQFRKYFNMFDKEQKGFIRATQVGQILRTMGQAFEERDLKQLIKEFDTDGSGEIEFEEFAAMVANFVVAGEDNEGLEEELREAFRLYDKEGNGYINVSDLRDILRALDDNVSEDELDEMIAEIDQDGSGTVDFDEFMEMMSGE
ncbi:unnamed protein product [Auanema sp. JU1783]|nr:unnamed protein product [Auanema sp. JU1783]